MGVAVNVVGMNKIQNLDTLPQFGEIRDKSNKK